MGFIGVSHLIADRTQLRLSDSKIKFGLLQLAELRVVVFGAVITPLINLSAAARTGVVDLDLASISGLFLQKAEEQIPILVPNLYPT